MRQLWSAAIGIDPDRLTTAGQVHGNGVLRVFADQAGIGARPGSGLVGIADALITNERGIVLLSMHADCLPILLLDPESLAIGVVHAGWRGTVANVVGAAIVALTDAFGTDPSRVHAYLGPAIGPECYEVGDDVAAAWTALAGHEHREVGLRPHGLRWQFDLPGANSFLLHGAGVPLEQIERSGICTRCGGDDWFSHRGQGPQTGRFGAMIALSE
jgi:YfiH family protein